MRELTTLSGRLADLNLTSPVKGWVNLRLTDPTERANVRRTYFSKRAKDAHSVHRDADGSQLPVYWFDRRDKSIGTRVEGDLPREVRVEIHDDMSGRSHFQLRSLLAYLDEKSYRITSFHLE